MLKEEKKETQKLTSQKTFIKTHFVQANISDEIISEEIQKKLLEIQKNGWNFSMMKISYKLTKRTTKTEKFGNSLKMYNIVNFKTIR